MSRFDEGFGAVIGCWLSPWIISMIINAFTFPYMINFWLIYFHKEPVVTWWEGILLGMVPIIGQFSIIGAVVTWISSLFM